MVPLIPVQRDHLLVQTMKKIFYSLRRITLPRIDIATRENFVYGTVRVKTERMMLVVRLRRQRRT
jgi:hypothetical protein